MNSNLPIDKQNIDNFEEQDLHEQAGLVDTGIDEDGDVMWCGTDVQWKKYEELLLNNQ